MHINQFQYLKPTKILLLKSHFALGSAYILHGNEIKWRSTNFLKQTRGHSPTYLKNPERFYSFSTLSNNIGRTQCTKYLQELELGIIFISRCSVVLTICSCKFLLPTDLFLSTGSSQNCFNFSFLLN